MVRSSARIDRWTELTMRYFDTLSRYLFAYSQPLNDMLMQEFTAFNERWPRYSVLISGTPPSTVGQLPATPTNDKLITLSPFRRQSKPTRWNWMKGPSRWASAILSSVPPHRHPTRLLVLPLSRWTTRSRAPLCWLAESSDPSIRC